MWPSALLSLAAAAAAVFEVLLCTPSQAAVSLSQIEDDVVAFLSLGHSMPAAALVPRQEGWTLLKPVMAAEKRSLESRG